MPNNPVLLNDLPGNFDTLLRNRLCLPPDASGKTHHGLSILIRGEAGTGKTTLALQLAYHLTCKAQADLDQGLYCSLEQDAHSLRHKLASMFIHQIKHCLDMEEEKPASSSQVVTNLWNKFYPKIQELLRQNGTLPLSEAETLTSQAEKHFKKNKGFPLRFDQHIEQVSGASLPLFAGNLEHGMSIVSKLAGEDEMWPLLVVDGLATVPASQRRVLGLDRLFDLVKQKSKVGVIIYEPTEEAEEQNLDHLADMVIELREHPLEGSIEYLVNEMHILKARYQDPARGWHQYKIRNWGLEFFPSIHFQVQMPAYMPRTYANSLAPLTRIEKAPKDLNKNPDTQEGSILEGLTGGMENGSITALFGSRGSFKSHLCTDFLTAGARKRKEGLFISLIDNFSNLDKNMLCPRLQCKTGECPKTEDPCHKFIHLFHQRPGCITPAEFLYYIKKRLDVKPGKGTGMLDRLVFWDLTQLDYRFPMLVEDSMFIPALLDTFKFKTTAPDEIARTAPETEKKGKVPEPRPLRSVIMGAGNAKYTRAVSAMADNVLYCWRDTRRAASDQTTDAASVRRDNKKANAPRPKSDKSVYGKPNAIAVAKATDISPRDLAKFDTYLLVYVDRRERHHEMGRNSLYAFPLVNDQLKLPAHEWISDHFSTEPSRFVLSGDNIKKIQQQQGLE